MRKAEEDLFWMAINAYHEARGEGYDGIKAVCHVVLNRSVKRKQRVKDVVFEKSQFSWTIQKPAPKILDKDAFYECQRAAEDAFSEHVNGDDLHGADHYYAFSGPNKIKEPYWVKAGKMTEVARIRHHVFYHS